jgi:hypothetical protein
MLRVHGARRCCAAQELFEAAALGRAGVVRELLRRRPLLVNAHDQRRRMQVSRASHACWRVVCFLAVRARARARPRVRACARPAACARAGAAHPARSHWLGLRGGHVPHWSVLLLGQLGQDGQAMEWGEQEGTWAASAVLGWFAFTFEFGARACACMQLVRTLEGHTGEVNALAVLPNGQFVFSGSDDATIRQWSADNGEVISELEPCMCMRAVRGTCVTPWRCGRCAHSHMIAVSATHKGCRVCVCVCVCCVHACVGGANTQRTHRRCLGTGGVPDRPVPLLGQL